MDTLEQKKSTDKQQPVVLFVKVAAKAASQQKAKDALLADVNGARTEEGNLKMELYNAGNDPDAFYLFERWQSQSALEDHFKQPYTRGAFELQNNALTAPIEMNYLEELWPLPGGYQKQQHQPFTTLIVPFETKPGCGKTFEDCFERFVPMVRNEKGNVEFHFHRVIGSQNRFVLYERWQTQQDLDMHNRLPGTAQLIIDTMPLLTKGVVEFVLFASDIS